MPYYYKKRTVRRPAGGSAISRDSQPNRYNRQFDSHKTQDNSGGYVNGVGAKKTVDNKGFQKPKR